LPLLRRAKASFAPSLIVKGKNLPHGDRLELDLNHVSLTIKVRDYDLGP
jgi:hypothetical protein